MYANIVSTWWTYVPSNFKTLQGISESRSVRDGQTDRHTERRCDHYMPPYGDKYYEGCLLVLSWPARCCGVTNRSKVVNTRDRQYVLFCACLCLMCWLPVPYCGSFWLFSCACVWGRGGCFSSCWGPCISFPTWAEGISSHVLETASSFVVSVVPVVLNLFTPIHCATLK